eukprot:496725_1
MGNGTALPSSYAHETNTDASLITVAKLAKNANNRVSNPSQIRGSNPSQIPIQSKQRSIDFKIHIAIDFGTDGCALAYYYNNKVTVYNKWMTKSRQRTTKVKTQILLNDKDEVVAFGDNAKIIYSSLSGNERRKWKFFDRFKMSLYEVDMKHTKSKPIDKQQKNKKIRSITWSPQWSPQYVSVQDEKSDIDAEQKENILKAAKHVQPGSFYLTTMNGIKCEPDIVFTSAFKHLQKIAVEYMNQITNNKHIQDNEIQWIFTVPAIWSEKAKYKMKTWLVMAGLINQNIQDQCLIVY